MLYQRNTYQPTARLLELRAGAEPTTGEIAELWQVYREGEIGWGSGEPSVIEFGKWLSASGEYALAECEPMEVAW